MNSRTPEADEWVYGELYDKMRDGAMKEAYGELYQKMRDGEETRGGEQREEDRPRRGRKNRFETRALEKKNVVVVDHIKGL